MTDESQAKKIKIATPDEVAEYATEGSEGTPDGPADQNAERIETAKPAEAKQDRPEAEPETDLQRAERERDEFKDKWLREKAEAQNQARRLRADRDEAVHLANVHFARSLLAVVDDLERTLEAAQAEGVASKKRTNAAALIEGVRIVYDHLLKVLGEHHVERIEAVGQPFDPTCHEAMTQQPSADHPNGTVLQEVQKGYRLKERVLRPARVIISSAPPDAEPAGEVDAEQGKDERTDDKG